MKCRKPEVVSRDKLGYAGYLKMVLGIGLEYLQLPISTINLTKDIGVVTKKHLSF